MSFLMTSRIVIKGFKPVPIHSLSWNRSIDDFVDTAIIRMPAVCRMVKNGYTYDRLPTGQQFSEGTPVEINCGYDYKNEKRFTGFIKRINFSTPLEIECEGYCYQLRQLMFNKTYASVSLRQLLAELVEGTDIKLSESIPTLQLVNIYFINVKRVQVLEYLKNSCFLTVHFDFNVLYAGLEQAQLKDTKRFRLGWNTIDDDGLKFEKNKELAFLTIHCQARTPTGQKIKAKSNQLHEQAHPIGVDASKERIVKVSNIYDPAALQKIADRLKLQSVFQGYEGRITAFAEPYVEPGMAAQIVDKRYPERTGKYFIERVAGSFGPDGGRQFITIGRTLSN